MAADRGFCDFPTYLSHLAVATDFDKTYQDAKLSVEFDAVNEQAVKGALSIRWRLLDPRARKCPFPIRRHKSPRSLATENVAV